MFEGSQLYAFAAAAAVLVVVPGPNLTLILSHSVLGGRAAGLATAAGVETGTLVHTVATALGLSNVLSRSALAFALLQCMGAAYLACLGLRALLRGEPSREEAAPPGIGLSRAYWQAVLTNVLNPKVALFFLALLPQFVRPERGHSFLQFLALGLIVVAIGLSFSVVLALAAGPLRSRLTDPAFARWGDRLTGTVFLALGVRLALTERA
jgi:threonine/homoserine/homoserine lactone efflux protein